MSIGAFEAKTRLSELLDRVSRGERIIITKHGTAVAALQPVDAIAGRPIQDVIDDIRSFRHEHHLGRDLIDEFRKEGRL